MSINKDQWTFFSNHGHVYFILAKFEDIILRDVAVKVGITERAVIGIVQDLENAGYITREKVGRNNKYHVTSNKTLRHPLEQNVQLSELTKIIKRAKDKS